MGSGGRRGKWRSCEPTMLPALTVCSSREERRIARIIRSNESIGSRGAIAAGRSIRFRCRIRRERVAARRKSCGHNCFNGYSGTGANHLRLPESPGRLRAWSHHTRLGAVPTRGTVRRGKETLRVVLYSYSLRHQAMTMRCARHNRTEDSLNSRTRTASLK